MLSTPVPGDSGPVGALNLYSSNIGFSHAQRALVSQLTSEAASVIGAQQARGSLLIERLGDALEARDLISLAQGILMERDNLSADEGYTQMRRDSHTTAAPLRQHAEAIVGSGPSIAVAPIDAAS